MIRPVMTRGTALNILKRRRDGIALKPSERERANAVLLFNLGRAIGRSA